MPYSRSGLLSSATCDMRLWPTWPFSANVRLPTTPYLIFLSRTREIGEWERNGCELNCFSFLPSMPFHPCHKVPTCHFTKVANKRKKKKKKRKNKARPQRTNMENAHPPYDMEGKTKSKIAAYIHTRKVRMDGTLTPPSARDSVPWGALPPSGATLPDNLASSASAMIW